MLVVSAAKTSKVLPALMACLLAMVAVVCLVHTDGIDIQTAHQGHRHTSSSSAAHLTLDLHCLVAILPGVVVLVWLCLAPVSLYLAIQASSPRVSSVHSSQSSRTCIVSGSARRLVRAVGPLLPSKAETCVPPWCVWCFDGPGAVEPGRILRSGKHQSTLWRDHNDGAPHFCLVACPDGVSALCGTQVAADERPGKHKHDDKAPHGKTAEGHGHTTDGTPTNTPGGKHPLRNMPTPAAPAGAMRRRSPAASSSTRPTA